MQPLVMGWVHSKLLARPHGDFPTTPKLVLTVPQTPLSATQGVFLSLILCGIFHSHKHGKKLNPTNLSKSFSSIPQEESVTCQKKVCHSVEIIVSLGKPELGGESLFIQTCVPWCCKTAAHISICSAKWLQLCRYNLRDTIRELQWAVSSQHCAVTLQNLCWMSWPVTGE